MKTSKHFGPAFNNTIINAVMRQNDGTFERMNALRFQKKQ